MNQVPHTALSVRPLRDPHPHAASSCASAASSKADAALLLAAMVTPVTACLEQASCELASICEDDAAPASAALYLSSTGFAAGMPLPELARRLAQTRCRPAGADDRAELAGRAGLLDILLVGDEAVASSAPSGAALEHRFGHWLTVLQKAWYAGAQALALTAIDRASALACAQQSPAERMLFHLFAALAMSRCMDGHARRGPDIHCAELRQMARLHPASAASFSLLADAAHAGYTGDALAALRGYEAAADAATGQGRHWMAALAWEEAAVLAQACGLGSVTGHYRQAALSSYGHWGAHGRLASLRSRWGLVESGYAGKAPSVPAEAHALQAAGLGELGLSIAHEVNQPLAAISLHAAAARKWLRKAEPDIERALSSIALISDAGRHAGEIVRSMQRLAAHRNNDMEQVKVDQTARDVLQLLQRRMRKEGIDVKAALGLGETTIHANATQLQQVMTNLLVNAIEALTGSSAPAGPKQISIATRPLGGHEVEIRISDNGPGVALHHRERVFGSLFSTKPGSTGLGLAICLAIVRAHGGRIAYEPGQPRGACFHFLIPVHPSRLDLG
jgi:signal transduction histidine kinase